MVESAFVDVVFIVVAIFVFTVGGVWMAESRVVAVAVVAVDAVVVVIVVVIVVVRVKEASVPPTSALGGQESDFEKENVSWFFFFGRN